jgi:hypothetical protein
VTQSTESSAEPNTHGLNAIEYVPAEKWSSARKSMSVGVVGL